MLRIMAGHNTPDLALACARGRRPSTRPQARLAFLVILSTGTPKYTRPSLRKKAAKTFSPARMFYSSRQRARGCYVPGKAFLPYLALPHPSHPRARVCYAVKYLTSDEKFPRACARRGAAPSSRCGIFATPSRRTRAGMLRRQGASRSSCRPRAYARGDAACFAKVGNYFPTSRLRARGYCCW